MAGERIAKLIVRGMSKEKSIEPSALSIQPLNILVNAERDGAVVQSRFLPLRGSE
jgi:hypothetical protein